MVNTLRRLSIKGRLFAVLLFVVIGIITLVVIAYSTSRTNLLIEKRGKLQDFVSSAVNVSKHFHEEALANRMSEEQAQLEALGAIEHMRYNGSEYIWVNDLEHNFVMHPVKPELNGTSAYNLADPDGTYLIRNAVSIARNEGKGFMQYRWSKPGTASLERKISFVQAYEPWAWVFGSGMYMDDVEDDLFNLALKLSMAGCAVMLVLLVLLLVIAKSISNPITMTVARMREISEGDGDLTVQLSTEGKDEISALAVQFNGFVAKIRTLVVDVGDSINVLVNSTDTLNQATTNSARNMLGQQSETEQVATAMNEMSAAAHEIAQNAEFASSNAAQAKIESHKSRSIVANALTVVDELASDLDTTTQVIDRLKSETENIGNVLTVIQGIAEQTNLLALNAAIEAARAGEQGRGFAVVADEVRALAQKTQQSTQEINEMITRLQDGATTAVSAMNNSLDKTRSTVETAHSAESAMDLVSNAISSIDDMNAQIAVASEEQSHVAEEINVNVNNIARLSEENRENSDQVQSLSDALKSSGVQMRETAKRFIV
ncbi:methyl-accepting chemotaxis sensory transducer with Cache sensor [Alteromonadaceae bacterium Bs31]|nr:methyl-accepting chemotaxis sensory transducer with Cache sensor [Alteromonadaceae bacterium Bs31]SMF61172.1 methyl-accepting chemotaxis sensory transducer with Cache sensor [Alteromonadaceae bacterium Bs31]